MTSLDDRFRPLAQTLLSKRGKAVTFYPITDDTDGSAYDVTTGTTTAVDGAAVTTYAAVAFVGKASRTGQDTPVSGVRRADLLLWVPAADFSTAPKAEDKVVFDNENWRVLAVESVYSGEEAALYGVYIRKP